MGRGRRKWVDFFKDPSAFKGQTLFYENNKVKKVGAEGERGGRTEEGRNSQLTRFPDWYVLISLENAVTKACPS